MSRSSAKILLIEPDSSRQAALMEALIDYDVVAAASAGEAIALANEHDVSLVILELSLAGHSGMEFLYEFRTYEDWQRVPVIVYSAIKLDGEVLRSRAWQQLNIVEYIYKPKASLKELVEKVQSVLDE